MAQSEVDQMKARAVSTAVAVRLAAAREYRAHVEPLGYQDATPSALQIAVVAALNALAQCWREDAAYVTEQRKKGHVSTSAELKQAAARLAGAAIELAGQSAEVHPLPLPEPELPPHTMAGSGLCRAPMVGPGSDDRALDCIRPPHEPPSSHVNMRGDRWPMAAAIAEAVSNLATEIARGSAPAIPTFLRPDPPFLAPDGPLGRRLDFSEVMRPIDPELRTPYRSDTQINRFGSCGLAYRIRRYHPDVVRRPMWASVGGVALHQAAAAFDQNGKIVEPWEATLKNVVEATEEKSSVPRDRWYVSGRGKENEDWWRVEGEMMLARYIAWSTDTDHNGTLIAQELDLTQYVAGVPVRCILDQVRQMLDGSHQIVDIKTGRQMPDDFFQLALYAYVWNLGRAFDPMPPVFGSFWNARNGELSSVDIWERYSLAEIEYRVDMMDQAEKAGAYVPRPSSFCVSCEVGHACPVNPRR